MKFEGFCTGFAFYRNLTRYSCCLIYTKLILYTPEHFNIEKRVGDERSFEHLLCQITAHKLSLAKELGTRRTQYFACQKISAFVHYFVEKNESCLTIN